MSDCLTKKIYILTIFISALLLFSVQPIIAKMILPELGGSPSVWQTIMMFFQILLLFGYGYVHITTTKMSMKGQIYLHRFLLICACLFLPFSLHVGTFFDRNFYPIAWLFETLLYSIAVPFFILSTTSPLLQRWFSLGQYRDSSNPYFLYNASNAGSLIALLSYPFIIEPFLSLHMQTFAWSGLFAVFLITIVYLSSFVKRESQETLTSIPPQEITAPTWEQKLIWAGHSFIPSSLMLGVTTYMTTDVAAIPLLWILPFALYLISFMIAFSKGMTGYLLCKKIIPVAVMASFLAAMKIMGFTSIMVMSSIALICFFVIAIYYHGTLALKKPMPSHLTYFYLWISIGGAAGGIFNAILAPILFTGAYEYLLVLLLALLACFDKKANYRQFIIWGASLLIVFFYTILYIVQNNAPLLRERNFFGISKVYYNPVIKANIYQHGTTIHGMQFTHNEKRLMVNSYYYPLHHWINLLPPETKSKPMALVGLGVGTSVCETQENQEIDIFEINPMMLDIAKNENYFTYLRDCKGKHNIILGDARTSLQKTPQNRYGFMIMDAYSSDSLPMHLLTKEAIRIYLDKLDKDGILAFHITNRHFDLKPALKAFANHFHLTAYVSYHEPTPEMNKKNLYLTNEWVLLTRNPKIFNAKKQSRYWKPLDVPSNPLWTDNYSSIFSALKSH